MAVMTDSVYGLRHIYIYITLVQPRSTRSHKLGVSDKISIVTKPKLCKICKHSKFILSTMGNLTQGVWSVMTAISNHTGVPLLYVSPGECCNTVVTKQCFHQPHTSHIPPFNQIYLVMLRPTQLTQASFLQKKIKCCKMVF